MMNHRNAIFSRAAQGALALSLLFGIGQAVQAAQVQQTRSFDYSPTTGLLTKEVVEPASSKLCLVTEYVYDAFGNRSKATQRNCNGSGSAFPGSAQVEAAAPADNGIAPRIVTTVYSYGADGSVTVVTTNAAGHQQTTTYDAAHGALLTQRGPNTYRDGNNQIVFSEWAYDVFGRKVLEKRPDGNGASIAYQSCAAEDYNCPAVNGASPVYLITTTPVAGPINLVAKTSGSPNGPYTRIFYDELDRPLQTETQGSDVAGTSRTVVQDIGHNGQGWVHTRTAPYFRQQEPPQTTRFQYDKLGRVTLATAPDGSRTTTTYDGLRTTVTNDLNQSTTKVRNVLGQVTQVIDANGKVLTLAYDPLGNLSQSTDSAGNVTVMHYDVRGRKLDMQDPDMGSWSYDYDAVGNLTRQTDARLQVTKLGYDVLNRLRTREEPSLNTSWTYDNCPQGIGLLCASSAANGYSRSLSYDGLGRASTEVLTLGAASYSAMLSYDANGRPLATTYPTQFKLQNVYSALGHLKQVVNGNATATVYWRADAMDSQGRITQQTNGNGVVTVSSYDPPTGRLKVTTAAGPQGNVQAMSYGYDTIGNLKTRNDFVTGLNTAYGYDALNRLVLENRSGAGVPSTQSIGWTYDEIGNITSRSDVGTYAYNPSGAGSVRPHAVTGVSGTVNGEGNPGYQYDANGNLTTTNAAGGTHVASWNSFNMVDSLTRVFSGSTSKVAFLYGSDRERVRETATKDGATTRVTDYMNPAQGAGLFYEQETNAAGTVKKKVYLTAAGQTIGVLVFDANNNLTATQYWHKDQLGSLVAVTDANGAVSEQLAYEPFGKRRNANGVTDANGTLAASTTARGFTEHEQLDEVGLINMNGRVFDPAISRFLSADPGIQAPQFMQDYNRYSYTVNNPMRFYDPSGFDIAVDCDDCGSPWGGSWGSSGSSSGSSSYYYGYNYNSYSGYGSGYSSSITLSTANAYSYQNPLGGLGFSLNANTYGSIDSPALTGGCLQCGGGTSTIAALKALGRESYWSLNDFWTGGYGQKAQIAADEGRYLDAFGNTILGTTYFGMSLATLGTGNAASTTGKLMSSEVEKLAAKSAEAAADAALAAGKRAGAAAELRVGDRVFTGVSGEAVPQNSRVMGALMGTPSTARAPWHGACAEIACLEKALNAGVDPAGGTARAVNIGVSGAGQNTPKAVCSSCADILRFFGVSW
jgi:RHS repeat-associated protein